MMDVYLCADTSPARSALVSAHHAAERASTRVYTGCCVPDRPKERARTKVMVINV